MSKIKFSLFPVLWLLSLTACSDEKTVHWKQEVQLQDGRVIVMGRTSVQAGNIFPENVSLEKSQNISFENPYSKEKISWDIPKGLKPYMLDFDRNTPYMVLNAFTVADYNAWDCPNPPFLVYRYTQGNWSAIPFNELPEIFTKRNVMDMSVSLERYSDDALATVEETQKWLKRLDADRRIISREKISAMAKGCDPDTLTKLGRQSEINYGR